MANNNKKKQAPVVAVNSAEFQDVAYKGAVPLRAFLGWVLLVVVSALLIGTLAASLLVNQRLGQLVQETATRVELQAQGRASTISEWTNNVSTLGKSIENAEIIRIFATDNGKIAGAAGVAPDLAQAVSAQKPYMDQLFNEFVERNQLQGAQLVLPDGVVLLSAGVVPEELTKNRTILEDVVKQAKGQLRPLRSSQNALVMDVVRPIMAVSESDKGPVVGVLWYTVPVGDKLASLVAATQLDREGERTALLQHGLANDGNGDKAQVVGRTNLAPLTESYMDIENRLGLGGDAVRVVQPSLVDGKPVFATVRPITGTPFALLQEYSAKDALGVMVLYKPGIYLIVSLLMVVLAALMLALTLHLMGQRNRTRVKLLGQTMEALVRVVEARDPYLSGHHSRVARLAVAVGNKMDLSVGERATLYYAAQLSSVGRLLVPRGVLAKKGKLSDNERSELEEHINQAITVLGDIEFDLPIVPIISQMYEREDGSGHPLSLKGPQISRMAKVLGACDAYVAMTSDRSHRKAMSKGEALKSMSNGSFADDVVAAIKGEKH